MSLPKELVALQERIDAQRRASKKFQAGDKVYPKLFEGIEPSFKEATVVKCADTEIIIVTDVGETRSVDPSMLEGSPPCLKDKIKLQQDPAAGYELVPFEEVCESTIDEVSTDGDIIEEGLLELTGSNQILEFANDVARIEHPELADPYEAERSAAHQQIEEENRELKLLRLAKKAQIEDSPPEGLFETLVRQANVQEQTETDCPIEKARGDMSKHEYDLGLTNPTSDANLINPLEENAFELNREQKQTLATGQYYLEDSKPSTVVTLGKEIEDEKDKYEKITLLAARQRLLDYRDHLVKTSARQKDIEAAEKAILEIIAKSTIEEHRLALIDLAKTGRLALLQSMVEVHPEALSADALFEAAAAGQLEAAKLLYEAGLNDPETLNTAQQHALNANQQEVVTWLQSL